jgi:hypothetical protein
MKPRIRVGRLIVLGALFGIGLLVRYALRDIRLDVDLLRESLERMPRLVLENLQFEREIGGDLWRIHVPLVERRDERIEVRSVDVRCEFADGKEWYFQSAYGVYSEKGESADLGSLLGTLETGTRVLNLESPILSWSRNDDVFLFPRGLTLYDAEFILRAGKASLDASGVVVLDEGGSIRWTQNLE